MIRFYNGKILSFAGGIKVSNDEVWVEGSRISYVGPAREDMPAFQRQIDLKGDLLLPGFKDAHTHTAMVFLRSYADDLPLQDWLYNKVFPHEAKLTPEAVYQFTRLGIMEYLSSGITASFDMYYHNEAYAKANVDCGFRTVICSAMNDFDADPTNIEREYLRFNNYNELVSYKLGIHAEYTTGVERMEYMASLAEKYQAPCYMHCAETKAEVESCLERSPLPYLSYCMACRDRFARKGRESVHILELVYGTAADHCPDISAKRYNRLGLKQQLLEEIWKEKVENMQPEFTLTYAPGAEEQMDDRMILKSDVIAVLNNLRETGEAILDADTGLCVTRARLGNVTFWVKYQEIPGGYLVFGAYSHRMNIVTRQ